MAPSQPKRGQATASGLPQMPPLGPSRAKSNPPITPGMPFRKMYLMREEIRNARTELALVERQLTQARKSPSYPPAELDQLQSALRFKTAELLNLQKKIEPLEANFRKLQQTAARNTKPIGTKTGTSRRATDSSEPQPSKRQKTDGGEPNVARPERDPVINNARPEWDLVNNIRPELQTVDSIYNTRPERASRPERDPVDNPRPNVIERNPVYKVRVEQDPANTKEPLNNTATLEILAAPGGCALTADECQYAHLDRLRRQYARPFELFCEEMDTISDNCLTGLCLAMPDMPWSVIVSRLAFLFKSTMDGGAGSSRPAPSDLQYLSTGTTIGCGQHVRYIRLRELMVIQDWRDFMRWAHNQSHIFNLCGQQSCIKLKHMCLEPIDCMASRNRCRSAFHSVYGGSRSTDQPRGPVPSTCSSPGCWPPCLFRNQFTNILHSATVEFAAFHHVSFGPISSRVRGNLYIPIDGRQLGKLVQNDKYQMVFPFQKSYGHIVVNQWENNALVEVDTLLSVPPLYTSEDVQPLLEILAARTKVSFNDISNSLFWYARRRNVPFVNKDGGANAGRSGRFDRRSPRYQCPFCHGFDNYESPATLGMVADFGDIVEAAQHILHAHALVSLTRKTKFLYEETYECPTIGEAWRVVLREDYDAVIASLGSGELPRALADLCGYGTLADRPFVQNGQEALVNEERVTMPEVKIEQVIY
ncbi:hypothetical protein F4861DRAFT_296394 [Xylaria intraflava]|nr:hypothetical protein F4861DRAFT_296394 [Xylaria intraflava]